MHRTIASYLDPIEAHIVCGRLQAEGIEAEGIEAHVADDQMNLANWEWRQAIGGTKVRVLSTQFEQARTLIAELDRGDFALDPDPSGAASPDRESWSSRLALFFGLGFGLPLPWRRPMDSSEADTRAD
jgi:hypothetical protein